MKLRFVLSILFVCLGLMQSKAYTYTNNADNTLYVSDASVTAGGQIELKVCMKNKVAISGMQFDMYLPEGVSVDSSIDSWGDIAFSASLCDTRVNPTKFTLVCSFPEEGNSRHLTFLCYATNASVAGGEGEIATVTLNVDGSVAAGNYDVLLHNVVVSNTSDTYDNTQDFTSTLTVTSSSSRLSGDVNGDGFVDVKDAVALIDVCQSGYADAVDASVRDVDGNGIVDKNDAAAIVGLYLNKK